MTQSVLLLLAIPGVRAMACTVEQDIEYFIANQRKFDTDKMTSSQECCAYCRGERPPSPVLPHQGRFYGYYSFNSTSNECFCKPSDDGRRQISGMISGSCGKAPPPPTSPPTPNYHGCLTAVARAQAYCNTSMSIAARVSSLIGSLNLSEKVSRMYSCVDRCDTCACPIDRLGLPAFAYLLESNTEVAATCLGPERCATTFSGPLGLGGSFNRTVWRQKGTVLATELRAFNNHGGTRNLGPLTGLAAFGPNINIVRDPRFGRNSELPGEDPFLSGSYAVEMVRAMQATDRHGHLKAVAYLKHFTAYSRETGRGHDSYNISKFDFGDSYLPQYEMGMVAGMASGVMCSYNAENGHPSCANPWLLREVLRERWKRPNAVVVTDGGAIRNLLGPPINASSPAEAAALALNAGADVNDGSGFGDGLEAAVTQGLVAERDVDSALTRSLTQLFEAGLFDPIASVEWSTIDASEINSTRHQEINYEAALQSIVLLQNEPAKGGQSSDATGHADHTNMLPLQRGKQVAVVGPHAEGGFGLLSDYAAEQSCFDNSDGCIPSIADAVRRENGPDGSVVSAIGVDIDSTRTSGMAQALAVASAADYVVLALGTDRTVERESLDRPQNSIALPGQQVAFAERVFALRKPTVLILINGGAVAIDGWTRSTRPASRAGGPSAIIEAFNPATNAYALGALLYGRENRWGKLPITLYPSSFAREADPANYDMSAPPGRTYKYYTRQPTFPFGHGLSYTSFSLKCEWVARLSVACTVANTGAVDGDEVVLAYHSAGTDVRARAEMLHPVPSRALIGFERVRVASRAATTATFAFEERALALTNATGDKHIYPGKHELIFSRGHGEEVRLVVYA